MNESLATHYLEDPIASLRAYKKLAQKALDQLNEEEFFIALDDEAKSIAVIMKHMAGNMFSGTNRSNSIDTYGNLRVQKPASETEHRFDAVSKSRR
jgi:hypothetical protein